MNDQPQPASTTPPGAASALDDGLASTLPWHVGFHNEIGDNLRDGNWQHEMVRYKAVNVCANNGRHVAWACSAEHAALIVEAVNKMANAKLT